MPIRRVFLISRLWGHLPLLNPLISLLIESKTTCKKHSSISLKKSINYKLILKLCLIEICKIQFVRLKQDFKELLMNTGTQPTRTDIILTTFTIRIITMSLNSIKLGSSTRIKRREERFRTKWLGLSIMTTSFQIITFT